MRVAGDDLAVNQHRRQCMDVLELSEFCPAERNERLNK
jgi:hypothetical protein